MTGDICDLPKLVELKKKYGARLMVDDAHCMGVIGKTGAGTAEYFGLTDEVDIISGTFSKSLASIGGYCACDREVAEFIRHTSRPFIFSASITPAALAATLEALHIIRSEPERVAHLTEVAEYMRECLRARNIKFADSKAPIIALFTYEQDITLAVCKRLFEEGVYANPVMPPAKAASRGDQIENAIFMEKDGVSLTCNQEDLSLEKVQSLLETLKNNAQKFKNCIKDANLSDGTHNIMNEILSNKKGS